MTVDEEVEHLSHRVETLRKMAMATEHIGVDFLDCLKMLLPYDAMIVVHCERLVELQPNCERWQISLKYAQKLAAKTEAALKVELAEMRDAR